MNLPNLLTVIRMALVPVFLVFFYMGKDGLQLYSALAFAVFIIASLTDALDGYIARKRSLITNFGKLMDPLADKVLTTAAFIAFVGTGEIMPWMVIVILAREFAITGLRGVAASEGVVIEAGSAGKFKTVTQIIALSLMLLGNAAGPNPAMQGFWAFVNVAGMACLWAAVIITVYSGAEYIWKSRKLLNLK
ncbi:MAG: CDP-diacylglycerol--glycerol-3-phosphate 3-phosphatidyltransferase [Clostridiales bacterium]|nr:CDP-diacylglycerol--glycerol-3-phosphate 3-phosphatidyltransferase [Clostridiales bacterium]